MGITEIGKKIISKIDKESKYNFSLYYINVDKQIRTETKTPTRGKIELPKSLGFSSRKDLIVTIHKSIKTHEETIRRTKIDLEEYSVKEAVNELFNNILLLDLTHGTNFAEKVNKKFNCKGLFDKNLKILMRKLLRKLIFKEPNHLLTRFTEN